MSDEETPQIVYVVEEGAYSATQVIAVMPTLALAKDIVKRRLEQHIAYGNYHRPYEDKWHEQLPSENDDSACTKYIFYRGDDDYTINEYRVGVLPPPPVNWSE